MVLNRVFPGHGRHPRDLAGCFGNVHRFPALVILVVLVFIVPVAGASGEEAEALAQGKALYESGRYNEALFAYDTILARDPENQEARITRAQVLTAMGLPAPALLSIDVALDKDPSSVPAWLERGRIMLVTGDPEAALEAFDRALALAPGNAGALEGRGDALLLLGRRGDAIDAWKAALTADPGNIDLPEKISSAQQGPVTTLPVLPGLAIFAVTITLVTVLVFGWRQLQSSRRSKVKIKGADHQKDISSDTEESPKKSPAGKKSAGMKVFGRVSPGVRKTLSGLLPFRKPDPPVRDERREKSSGSEIGERSTVHEGSIPSIEGEELTVTTTGRDLSAEIVHRLDTLLGNSPGLSRGAGLAEILLYTAGEYEGVLKRLDQGEDTASPNTDLVKMMALRRLGRLGEAWGVCNQILDREPDNFWVVTQAAFISSTLGDYQAAIRACDQGISLRPEAADLFALKGRLYAMTGDDARAVVSLQRATEYDPDDSKGFLEKGGLLVRLGRYEEALEAYRRVAAIDGETPEIRVQVEMCRKHLKESPAEGAGPRTSTGTSPSYRDSGDLRGVVNSPENSPVGEPAVSRDRIL